MIEIRPYSPEYAGQVGPFVVGIQHEFGVPITLADQPDLSDIEHAYVKPGGHFWLALDGKELVGTIALINAGSGIGVIRKMFVAPTFRGAPHRLGQRLLDTLMPWARAHGFTKLYLGTLEIFVAARRFYEKNGFSSFPQDKLPQAVDRIKMFHDNTYYAMELAA